MLNDLSDELIPRSIRITNYTYSFKEKEQMVYMFIDAELENVEY